MRFERVSSNQFTIFLTFDDLSDRGFTKDDLLRDAANVRRLFTDMMHEASTELGFELAGVLLIQVHLMQAQGMHVVVTQKESNSSLDDDFVEMKVMLDESKELIFAFHDFESIIQVAAYLRAFGIRGGQIYHMTNCYYMLFHENDLQENNREDIIAIMSEFSFPSMTTSYHLNEHATIIMASSAVEQIMTIFHH